MNKIIPTYEEGFARGASVTRERDELRRVADVLDRDASQVETLEQLATTIVRSLGRVSSSERTAVAGSFARQLVTELEALHDHFTTEANDYRLRHREASNERID